MSKVSHDLFKIIEKGHSLLKTPLTKEITFPMSEKVEDEIDKAIDTLRFNDGVFQKVGIALSAP